MIDKAHAQATFDKFQPDTLFSLRRAAWIAARGYYGKKFDDGWQEDRIEMMREYERALVDHYLKTLGGPVS